MLHIQNVIPHVSVLLILVSLAGCDNSADDTPPTDFEASPTADQLAEFEENTTLRSGIATPKADGTFSGSFATIFKGGFEDRDGNGYAFELGREGTAFSAFGGILPGTDLGPLPTSGLASMSGAYQIHEVGKSDGEERDYGGIQSTTGRITIRADFDYNTLQGNDGVLNIDGTFSGDTLTGAAYFNQRPAVLVGKVGGDSAVGVFHGTDDATAYVGGFLVER